MLCVIVELVRSMGWQRATRAEVAELLPLAITGPGRWMTDADLELWDYQVMVAWRIWRLHGKR